VTSDQLQMLASWQKTAEKNRMKKINPFLWFDSEAEEAAKFYAGIFKNSKIGRITRYGEGGPRPKGSVMTVEFTLDRVDFVALNGGPQFKSPKRSRSRSTARPRMRSIISGRNFPPTADRPGGAAGSKTNSVSRGRSTRSFSAICWPIPMPGRRIAS
jgi:hypothetical protein